MLPSMNRHERIPGTPGLAVLIYRDADFQVVQPGQFVLCAVTGQRIALEDLRYWNVERQEAYASATVATERHEALKARGRG